MKAIVLTKDMKDAMVQLNRTLAKQHYTSVYTQVMLSASEGELRMCTYNGNFATKVYVSADVGADFELCIDGPALKKAVDSAKGKTIEIASDGALSSGGVNYKPKMSISVEDMYSFTPISVHILTIDGAALKDALHRTKDVMSKDLTRVDFHGLNFVMRDDKLHIVGTDGHRLHVVACEVSANACEALERGLIVPSDTILALHRMLSKWEDVVDIAYKDDTLQFSTSKFEVKTKLVPGIFPEFWRVIPKRSDLVVAVDKQSLLDAAKGVEKWTSKISNITVEHSGSTMQLHAECEDGEASTVIDVSPKHPMDKRYGINVKYLIQALNTANGMLELSVTNTDEPLMIKEVGNVGVTYIIMPMHLK